MIVLMIYSSVFIPFVLHQSCHLAFHAPYSCHLYMNSHLLFQVQVILFRNCTRYGSLPEPYLWWVHQTGSTVYAHQSASCELWLWLVRLDWHSDLHAAICLPKYSGLDLPCRNQKFPISDRPIFRSQFLIKIPMGFLISGLSTLQAVKFSANTQYIPYRNILFIFHKYPSLYLITSFC